MKLMGIDIGSSTSPMAIALIEDDKILNTLTLKQKKDVEFHVFLDKVYDFVGEQLVGFAPDKVTVEETYYMGKFPLMKANQRHQRLIGVVMAVCACMGRKPTMLAPTSIKKIITGSGRAEKDAVANALIGKVTNNRIVEQLIAAKRWDETDALAIALAGKDK